MGREQHPDASQPPAQVTPSARPLSWHDLPQGFGASWRLTPTGVRWRYLEVLRGRYLEVFLAGTMFLLANFIVGSLIRMGVSGTLGTFAELLDWSSGLAFGDEYELAIVATGTLLALSAT